MSSTPLTAQPRMRTRKRSTQSPTFEWVPQVAKEWVQAICTGKYPGQNTTNKTYNDPNMGHSIVLVPGTGAVVGNTIANPNQSSYHPKQGQRKMKCYYCEGEHHIRDCKKFTKDKAKYKLKTVDLAKKYKDKFRQTARKGNILVNEIASVPKLTYPVEQAELLIGSLGLSDSESS